MAQKQNGRASKRNDDDPVIVKKYANRRLYNTASSTYVTLEDLSDMVKEGVDFIVHDAKSGDDITRAVLTQIIFEQESRGQNLLPVQFLRRLIRFYGDSLQSFVPSYLEMSMEAFAKQHEQMRERFSGGWPSGALEAFQDQTRKNMELFDQTVRMFSPFRPNEENPGGEIQMDAGNADDALTDLRREMQAMQRKLEALSQDKDHSSE